MDTGTGAVHTAPAHGADDFNTGVKYGLDLHCDVDDGGILRNGLPEYEGQQVFKANPLIVELLKSRGVLLGFERIEHSYPHCWRCHNPIIFRATEQWFIAMEGKLRPASPSGDSAKIPASGGTLRTRALEEIKKVKWDPAWGEERISNMVAGASGLVHLAPARLGRAHRDVPVWRLQRVPQRSGRESPGGRAVRTRRSGRVVPVFGRANPACGNQVRQVRQHEASARRWTSSTCGSSRDRARRRCWAASRDFPGPPTSTSKAATSIAAGSSLPCCARLRPRARRPTANVATVGWTLDPQGRAMHKSLGNTVDPVEIADKLGAEIVRLWVASVDFREDVMASDDLMQRVADSYRKIRNTFRYILGNLEGFDPARDSVPFAEMHPLDQYILLRAAEVTNDVREHYDCIHLPSAVSAAEGFLHRRSERDLLRCAEGPAVYVSS